MILDLTEDFVTLATPGGGRRRVDRTDVNIPDFDKRSIAFVRSALATLYTPYVFGGRSLDGPDCSGLVSNVCLQQGLPLPRDAGQQFLTGTLVATFWYRDAIQPGDHLYFINNTGKIYHTGIALSATRTATLTTTLAFGRTLSAAGALASR